MDTKRTSRSDRWLGLAAVVFIAQALACTGCTSSLEEDLALQRVPLLAGEPMRTRALRWQYVPFDSTRCRDGSSTGLALNVNPSSDKLLVYLDQGGACFNDTTCLLNVDHWSAFDMLDPTNMINSGKGILSRTDPGNPFAAWNIVYVPNCTGDANMGTTEHGYAGQPQVGYHNVSQFLARIVPTFPDVSEVVLSGTSSGGFGASYNWLRVQDAFGDIPVHLLDDSGPPVGEEVVPPCIQKKLADLWGLRESLHPACSACDLASGHLVQQMLDLSMERLAATRRVAMLSHTEDSTMRTFFGYGLNDCKNFDDFLPPTMELGTYTAALKRFGASQRNQRNFALYLVVGEDHVMLSDPASITSAGVALNDFLKAFVAGSDQFVSVTP